MGGRLDGRIRRLERSLPGSRPCPAHERALADADAPDADPGVCRRCRRPRGVVHIVQVVVMPDGRELTAAEYRREASAGGGP